MANTSETAKTCASCGKSAHLVCNGCAKAPAYLEDTAPATCYCGVACQKSHWAQHKDRCKLLQRRKMVHRAVKVIQDLYYLVLRRSSQFSVEKVDHVDEDTMLGRNPRLTLFSDCVSYFFECQTVALNRKLWAVTVSPLASIDWQGTGSDSDYINSVDQHEVFLIMMHSPGVEMQEPERYAVDLTHAQYGHHDETLMPWKTYVETRVHSNEGLLPLGRAREKRKEIMLQEFGNEGRETLIILEKFGEAVTAAVRGYPGPGWTKIWKEQDETIYQRQVDRVFQHVANSLDQMVAAKEDKATFRLWSSMAEKRRLEAAAEAIRKHKLDLWGHDLRGPKFVSAMKVMKARQAKERDLVQSHLAYRSWQLLVMISLGASLFVLTCIFKLVHPTIAVAPNLRVAPPLRVPPILRVDTDPYHLPSLPGTTISLILSGFSGGRWPPRPHHFEGTTLLSIAANAQASIVRRVIEVPGDGPIPEPNLEWYGKRYVLRINHNVDKEFK
ncbi:MAG: hypothetical protein Q9226_005744 [Calogaya cf. arnoldii]